MTDRKAYMREYQRKWIAARRAVWFADKKCVRCGSTESLELDHVDPSTKIHHAIWSWSLERREKETAKCQVLCKICHLDKTVNTDMRRTTHGTETMYKQGCRCRPCTDAKMAERNRYNARKRLKV